MSLERRTKRSGQGASPRTARVVGKAMQRRHGRFVWRY
ncbi:hypothetical protein GJA_2786 [Janthinobacterium agaricidamnosum NBRC 102515 = DSM 9628]|uniref:Uncharacterized protein n=1 Tax=Janthinobacterium agaricidamnosum NBRC 102515 = DSM 9628 TaxID=1349767 RepID=W0V6B7_9BURK|nr:hypothetical protein GJA_2786 [Janthinobacterium agaricidamnosum NBRC 102515 = DSM 9628]